MEYNIQQRKKIFTLFTKRLEKDQDFKFLNKKNILGEGGQGKVYRYCLSKPSKNCTAVKKIYLKEKQSKYVEDPYDKRALRESIFIELASMKLTNEIILQKICPNFILNYYWIYKERSGICDDIYPISSYFFNEFIDNSDIYTEWVKRHHSIDEWYNAYFQITVAIYTLQRHLNMIHLDLHSDNIIVRRVNPGGHWTYIIDNKKYYLPNLGFILYINDFGHAWIPDVFQSWFIRQRYNKRIHKNFDIMNLFRSTLKFSTSPVTFKKHIRYIIKELRGDKNFVAIIKDIWSDYRKKDSTSKNIDIYDLDKNIDTQKIPVELRNVVVKI